MQAPAGCAAGYGVDKTEPAGCEIRDIHYVRHSRRLVDGWRSGGIPPGSGPRQNPLPGAGRPGLCALPGGRYARCLRTYAPVDPGSVHGRASAHAVRGPASFNRIQWRGLQLPGAARRAGGAGASLRLGFRHRSASRGLDSVGARLPQAPAGDVCLRGAGSGRRDPELCARCFRDQAVFLCRRWRRVPVRFGASGTQGIVAANAVARLAARVRLSGPR